MIVAHSLLAAAAEHGPGNHGPVAIAVVLIAVVGGLVYLALKSRAGRTRSERGAGKDRARGA